jgi:hypothetical protein
MLDDDVVDAASVSVQQASRTTRPTSKRSSAARDPGGCPRAARTDCSESLVSRAVVTLNEIEA